MPTNRHRQRDPVPHPDSKRVQPQQLAVDLPIVAIGASSGGLDASRRLVAGIPARSGMAFILIQHLDPTHESMMVGLLAGHTALTVCQAEEGMVILPDHLYAIPPGVTLTIRHGALHLAAPEARRGTRMPFDDFLVSLAEACGQRAVAVVLTGTGGDGSQGVAAIRQHGGWVIAQDPSEAEFDGMPRSAIATGCVNAILPLAAIPAALLAHASGADGDAGGVTHAAAPPRGGSVADILPKVVALLRAETGNDFTLYKHGTLLRRIERRMAMADIPSDAAQRYLDILDRDADERDRLASDLLIHVTGFFRDPQVFAFLAGTVVPALMRDLEPGKPLRIWVAGCSTGEEAYSLAILFREAIAASGRHIRLQVFASDVDPAAITTAREGAYPETIAADVSEERLRTFFVREKGGYRVSPDLRSDLVFVVQDILADPPFSRLDMISCRNVLIYLMPEAQAKVVAICHFALRRGGILLLGGAEAIPDSDRRFEMVAKEERVFRHTVGGPVGELPFPGGAEAGTRLAARQAAGFAPSRLSGLAELCRRMVINTYAPAALLINLRRECLYSLGPIDRYLRVAPGHASSDILAMARRGLAVKLRVAIDQAREGGRKVVIPAGWPGHEGGMVSFRIDVQPAELEGETLLLIAFVEEAAPPPRQGAAAALPDLTRVTELERELDATRATLDDAIRDLDASSQEQKAINDEALSINEEFQSTNEELLASKEELQSMNEELVALNSQLHETLEQQRATSTDLQNVLFSTDVATLFLDSMFRIRLFTPATTAMFSIIASDIGRPITDLRSLAPDHDLADDGKAVLGGGPPIEREILADPGRWFLRRVMPYRGTDERIEGVVITFSDITDRKRTARALAEAQRLAEAANAAKSRFLAAASHDLRQPLQTLALIRGLLGRTVTSHAEQILLGRLDETLNAMSGMLNTLLDINQIESGAVRPTPTDFPLGALLARLCDEFAYAAHAKGLDLRAVPSSLAVRSDPHLLEQMIRNLLSNALKYTPRGKVLVGCRRRRGTVSVEIWDTGIGIHGDELPAIFEEYYQVGGKARGAHRGLGLGLSIVQRLGNLLGHHVTVRSRPGKGSMFAIEVPRGSEPIPLDAAEHPPASPGKRRPASSSARILVVEDDPELLSLLAEALTGDGYSVVTAADGEHAVAAFVGTADAPDLILADYNLPGTMTGLAVAAELRTRFRETLPAIILTGDIATATLRDIAAGNALQLSKPVQLATLSEAVQQLLPPPPAASGRQREEPPVVLQQNDAKPMIFVVDDDRNVLDALQATLEEAGFSVACFATAEDFLAVPRTLANACLLLDVVLPGLSGLGLLQRLRDAGTSLPTVMITGQGDVAMAVEAMRAGAADFIEKPVQRDVLLASITRAMEQNRTLREQGEAAVRQLAGLTPRQRQIMDLVLAGAPSKIIAADLGISRRTVENHRAAIMHKTKAKSLPALARLAIAAASLQRG